MRRQGIRIAAVAVMLAVSALASAASASAIPYRNWAQTPNNSAGIIYHPHGDYIEVWNNGPGDYGVSIAYNYKGIKDRWKSAGEIKDPGHSWQQHNFAEKRRIYFYIIGPDNTKSPISEYRTSGR
jgi:hypothetical protein